jgi:hypothetical protein
MKSITELHRMMNADTFVYPLALGDKRNVESTRAVCNFGLSVCAFVNPGFNIILRHCNHENGENVLSDRFTGRFSCHLESCVEIRSRDDVSQNTAIDGITSSSRMRNRHTS